MRTLLLLLVLTGCTGRSPSTPKADSDTDQGVNVDPAIDTEAEEDTDTEDSDGTEIQETDPETVLPADTDLPSDTDPTAYDTTPIVCGDPTANQPSSIDARTVPTRHDVYCAYGIGPID